VYIQSRKNPYGWLRRAGENETVPRKPAAGRTKSPRRLSDSDEVTLEIEGQQVRCTRLSKILYPQARFTKADVIDYYVHVAPFILPHLKDRPVTLKRYPDGLTGEAYWDKDPYCKLPL
jgi:hypothetical protein